MTKIIPTRNFSLGLDKKKSTLEGVAKHKRRYVRKHAIIGKEVDVSEKQADWFVGVGWAKYVSKEKKLPKKQKVTTSMLQGEES